MSTTGRVGWEGGTHMAGFADPRAAFTARYRGFVAQALDRFDFFGVDPRGIPRRYRFENGYVPLTLESPDGRADGVGVGGRSDRTLDEVPRALLRGVAGGGKSTLQRWLAVSAAVADHPAGEGRRVPFLLELGRLQGARPELERLVADTLRREMPTGWVEHVLAGQDVLLLLDGLDEVRPRERGRIEDWIDECLTTYPGTRCVVTTRPSVVAERRWTDAGFRTFDLLPMSRHSVTRYVHGWHEMARADYPEDTEPGAHARAWLTGCEHDLLATLSRRPALSGLSRNPLLAGLLCAIHLDRGEHLPENRRQVYDAALDLLLVRWPELRRRRRQGADPEPAALGAVEGDPTETRLGVEEQTKLLQRLAVWLVRNREMALAHPVALAQIESSLIGLRAVEGTPERILAYLAEQSGVLRELPDSSLEFVHRTFRDYLAAKELVEEADVTTLLDNADKPLWQDVVVLAGAQARPMERRLILERLLARAGDEPQHRDTLSLLAAAVLEQSPVLPAAPAGAPDFPGAVREALSRLVPPRTSNEADELAAVGPIVLDLLPGPEAVGVEDAELVVRTLAGIATRWNPPGTIERLLAFAARPTRGMLRQLLPAWGRSGDYESFARDVLSVIDFGGILVQLQNQRRVDHVHHLATITDLRIDHSAGDLTSVARLPGLRRLTIHNNEVTDLGPLAGTRLEHLALDNCSARAGTKPVDLAPVTRMDLRRLTITGIRTRADLSRLASARVGRLLVASAVVADQPLPAMTLRHLAVVGRARPLPDLDPLAGLVTVTLGWLPDDAVLRALDRYGVRHLLLWKVAPAALPATAVRVRFVGPARPAGPG